MAWVVGLMMSLAAGMVGAVAKLGLKKRHMIIAAEGDGMKSRTVLALSVGGLIANPILDVLSYGLISQTMKAPLGGIVTQHEPLITTALPRWSVFVHCAQCTDRSLVTVRRLHPDCVPTAHRWCTDCAPDCSQTAHRLRIECAPIVPPAVH